jgi:hypothetical protein
VPQVSLCAVSKHERLNIQENFSYVLVQKLEMVVFCKIVVSHSVVNEFASVVGCYIRSVLIASL